MARYMMTLPIGELKHVLHLLLVRRPQALVDIVSEYNLMRNCSHIALTHKLRNNLPVPVDMRGVIHW